MVINVDAIRFMGVPQRTVDVEVIRAFIEDEGAKRICFASHHQNALRRSIGTEGLVGRIVLPFDEPFNALAKQELHFDNMLFPSKFGSGFYRLIFSEEEYTAIEGLISKYKDVVFLRDTLDLSVALSMHESEPGVRTALGEHEYQLKYQSGNRDTSADKAALQAELQRRLEEMPFFKHAAYICAIPSNKPFMRELVAGLTGFAFEDISEKVSWQSKNGSLKDVDTADEKLDMIQSWGLTFADGLDLNGKTILLVDDLYHSGVTMQYIAMKMKEAGAKRVFGMALVKSLGN